MDEDAEKTILAHPMPSFDNPFRPHLESHVTDTKPFSFDSHTQEMFQRREHRLNAVLEEEEKVNAGWLYNGLLVLLVSWTCSNVCCRCCTEIGQLVAKWEQDLNAISCRVACSTSRIPKKRFHCKVSIELLSRHNAVKMPFSKLA